MPSTNRNVLYVSNNVSIAQQLVPKFVEVGLSLSIIEIRELLTRNNVGKLDCICFVTDLRIPHFNELEEKITKKGERTGEVLFEIVRRNNKHLPIIILFDPGQSVVHAIPDANLFRYPKLYMPPQKLAALISSRFAQ